MLVKQTSPLTLCLTILLLVTLASLGQSSVKGHLEDALTHRPLSLATLSIFKKADTTLLIYRLSDPSGNFRIPAIPPHTSCYLVVSHVGYEVIRKDIEAGDNNTLDLGTLSLHTSTQTLDEALVTAERPPVRIYHDTIEFNAASFRTLPDALVEDLLRKLPGVDVDRAGNIMVNGRVVNRILVDGKYFFGDDPKMASRNLPANSIDKVQVMDDKEQIDRSTDGDMTRIGKVINLTLKRSIKKGWFGKTYAGGGTDDRYQIGGIANIYRDTLQLSLLGFSNNINAGGFTVQDIGGLGGFNRSGINSIAINKKIGTEGFAVNGINFGGGEAGVNRSTGAGFNLNHTPNKKWNLYAQYFFGYNRNDLHTTGENRQSINDTLVTTQTNTRSDKDLFSHVANIGLNYHPDPLTDLVVRATGNYSQAATNAGSEIGTQNSKLGKLNTGNGNLLTHQYTGLYSHEIRLTKKFSRKPGRVLNLVQTVQYQDNLNRNTTLSNNIYYYPDADTTLFDLFRRQETPNLSAQIAASLAEPLTQHWTLRVNANYQYLRDRYDLLQAQLSNGYRRIQNIFFGNALLAYNYKKFTVTGGLAFTTRQIVNTFTKTNLPINFNLVDVLPSLAVNWKAWNLQYNETVTVPDINLLSPVPDSTNPFYIIRGNPNLQPGRRRALTFSYFSFDQKSGLRANLSLRGSLADRDVIFARTVTSDGVQSVVPVNTNDSRQLSLSASIGKDFRNRHFIFSLRVSPYANSTSQQLLVNGNSSTATTREGGPRISLGLNWNDKVEIDPDYSYIINETSYTDPVFTPVHVHTHQLQTDIIVRAPGKLIWETKLLYRYNSQVVAGLPQENTLLNVALGYPVLAHNRGQLKLNIYNLLDQNDFLNVSTSGNSIIRQQTNTLSRYLLLTFTYNIQNFSAENETRNNKQRLFLF